MNLDELKSDLPEEKFAALREYVSDLVGQRDAARKESIEGRKSLKAKVEELSGVRDRLLEKLGLDSSDDVDSLPDLRGQAEAAKQFEAKLKRLERQVAEVTGERDAAIAKHRSAQQKAALAAALGKHDFIDRDLVESFVETRLAWEGDDLLYRAGEDKLISVEDAIAEVAKTKPHLLKSTGSGGSGYRPPAGGGREKNPFAPETRNLTEQVLLAKSNPTLAAQLKAAAEAQ